MSIHPDVASRFPLLEGLRSFEQLMSDPELESRFHAFLQYPWAAPAPEVPVRDAAVPGPHGPVPVRLYGEPRRGQDVPCLVWLHGGGFTMGDLDMPEADRTAREVHDRSGAFVVSVDYRLAVDGVHYPVPLDDCVAVVRWVRHRAADLGVDPDRITLGGASAGGNLAAGTALRLRDEDGWLPATLLPVYPALHPVLPASTPALDALMAEVPEILRFPPQAVAGITANYVGGPPESADGYAMPGLADLTGLCPTVVVNAEYDDLRASGEAFTVSLAAAGVDVRQELVPGVLHGFLNLPAEVEPVGEAFQLLADVVLRPSPARLSS